VVILHGWLGVVSSTALKISRVTVSGCETMDAWEAEVDVGRVLLDEGTHERAERQHASAAGASLVEGGADELRREAHSLVLGCDDSVLEGATGTNISVGDVSDKHAVDAKLESRGSWVIPD
jgi:hypothetical protein